MQQQSAPPQPSEPEPSGDALDQAAIDQLMQQQSAPAQTSKAESSGGALDQADIDRMFQSTKPSVKPAEEADSTTADSSTQSEPNFEGALTQDELDRYLAAKNDEASAPAGAETADQPTAPTGQTPAKAPPPPAKPVPNALGARTLSPHDLKSLRVLKTGVNSEVTGIRRGAHYLPEEWAVNTAAHNAIQRLFALASGFRGVARKNRYDKVASVVNKFGAEAVILLTKSELHPIRVQIKDIPTFNLYNKFESTEQSYLVDHFTPNSGATAKRWVKWFAAHFEPETLESLSQLS